MGYPGFHSLGVLSPWLPCSWQAEADENAFSLLPLGMEATGQTQVNPQSARQTLDGL